MPSYFLTSQRLCVLGVSALKIGFELLERQFQRRDAENTEAQRKNTDFIAPINHPMQGLFFTHPLQT
jgi:hypothetical protein